MVKTHWHRLVEDHGLKTKWNPSVECACGRVTNADMCVDLTPLPIEMRQALGLDKVEFLCDGCQSRLFRDRHVLEAEFYGLLGADEGALHIHNARDAEHELGVFWRHEVHKPRHTLVTHAKVVGKARGEILNSASIPLMFRERTHVQQARWLSMKYTLHSIPDPEPVP